MRVIGIIVALLLSGCATVAVQEAAVEKTGTVPAIGAKATATVGSVMYSQFKYWSKDAYRLTSGVSVRLGLGRVSALAGDTLVQSKLDTATAYCTEKNAYVDPLVGPLNIACFLDSNNDGAFETVKAAPGAIWLDSDINPPVAYERSQVEIPRNDSFKYELLYEGASKGTIRLSYREYLNDFARPAFFQDVTYDIPSMPMTITFRTLRIDVLAVEGSHITYRVMSGL